MLIRESLELIVLNYVADYSSCDFNREIGYLILHLLYRDSLHTDNFILGSGYHLGSFILSLLLDYRSLLISTCPRILKDLGSFSSGIVYGLLALLFVLLASSSALAASSMGSIALLLSLIITSRMGS